MTVVLTPFWLTMWSLFCMAAGVGLFFKAKKVWNKKFGD